MGTRLGSLVIDSERLWSRLKYFSCKEIPPNMPMPSILCWMGGEATYDFSSVKVNLKESKVFENIVDDISDKCSNQVRLYQVEELSIWNRCLLRTRLDGHVRCRRPEHSQ